MIVEEKIKGYLYRLHVGDEREYSGQWILTSPMLPRWLRWLYRLGWPRQIPEIKGLMVRDKASVSAYKEFEDWFKAQTGEIKASTAVVSIKKAAQRLNLIELKRGGK